jgi:Bacterial PH domain
MRLETAVRTRLDEMNDPWWGPVLQWGVWGVLMALVMGWLAKSRLRRRPVSEARRLVHPPSTLIVGLVCLAFFLGLAIVSNVYANKTTTVWTTAAFLGFAALSVPVVASYFLGRHEVSEEALTYGTLGGRRLHLRWSDVVRVRYAPSMQWFKLETRTGHVARVSAMLIGLPEFARLVLAHVPAAAIDSETAAILKTTAGGDPPSLWA